MKNKSIYLYQIVGWNLEGDSPQDMASVSSLYEDFNDARKEMIKFVKEDGLEDCIDDNIDLKDKDLDCITIDCGNRGYYIEDITCIVSSKRKVKGASKSK